MRISVAMATWNGERFLAEQLESIAHQTRIPDEVVISDDASSDATLKIARAFADNSPFDVVILANRERVGYAANFIRAMEACGGDLIAFSDQDDLWHSAKLAKSELPFKTDPEVSLVIHSARTVDESLRPVWSHPANHIRRRRHLAPGELPPFPFTRAGFTMLFRAIFIRTIPAAQRPSVAPGRPMPHDTWINFLCGALGGVVYLPDELVLFRRHSATTTDSWSGHSGTAARRVRGPQLRLIRDTRRVVHDAVALRSEADTYRLRADAVRERLAYLEVLRPVAPRLGHSASAGLERAIESHKRYAEIMDRRAAIYANRGAGSRAVRVCRHALLGDYRPRSRGGLGPASLARDLAVGLTRGRSAEAGTGRR